MVLLFGFFFRATSILLEKDNGWEDLTFAVAERLASSDIPFAVAGRVAAPDAEFSASDAATLPATEKGISDDANLSATAKGKSSQPFSFSSRMLAVRKKKPKSRTISRHCNGKNTKLTTFNFAEARMQIGNSQANAQQIGFSIFPAPPGPRQQTRKEIESRMRNAESGNKRNDRQLQEKDREIKRIKKECDG